MIKKLKLKFILLSVTSLFLLLAVMVIGMNVINYSSVIGEADEILSLLSQNRGTFPGFSQEQENPQEPSLPGDSSLPEEPAAPGMGQGGRLPQHMSPELPYESRYFSVVLTSSGEQLHTDVSRIASVDRETAYSYAQRAMAHDRATGFEEDFRFLRSAEGDTVRITFLDCGRRLDAFRTFLCTSVGMALIGMAVILFVLCFFAGRILRPVAESYQKQKRFITDAGHEIKTPLTVINANTDLLEMELGRNDSLTEIRQQTRRLTALTNDLVYLARMEESERAMPMIDFPISEIVQETAESFRAPAKAEEKEFVCSIQPMLSLCGNDRAIGQLVSLLLDNALKYTPKHGRIECKLSKQGHNAVLSIYNTTSYPVEPDQLEHIFDRFYRTDPSRNSGTGGHGIGLSVAQAIVRAHGGKISAQAADKHSFRITATLPM